MIPCTTLFLYCNHNIGGVILPSSHLIIVKKEPFTAHIAIISLSFKPTAYFLEIWTRVASKSFWLAFWRLLGSIAFDISHLCPHHCKWAQSLPHDKRLCSLPLCSGSNDHQRRTWIQCHHNGGNGPCRVAQGQSHIGCI